MTLRAMALVAWVTAQGVTTSSSIVCAFDAVDESPKTNNAIERHSTTSAASTPASGHRRPAPYVVRRTGLEHAKTRSNSARQGWLLRSNSALGLGRVDGVPSANSEHQQLEKFRFATTNHVSIGYGWRPNWALTLDGFRAVVPHYPHPHQKPEFEMRVDAETLALGLGSTLFIAPWSMHVGSSIGFAMSRIGGDLLTAPTHKGIGSLAFAGFELMRSERIGVVLSAQLMTILAHRRNEFLATRTYAVSLGVTYW